MDCFKHKVKVLSVYVVVEGNSKVFKIRIHIAVVDILAVDSV